MQVARARKARLPPGVETGGGGLPDRDDSRSIRLGDAGADETPLAPALRRLGHGSQFPLTVPGLEHLPFVLGLVLHPSHPLPHCRSLAFMVWRRSVSSYFFRSVLLCRLYPLLFIIRSYRKTPSVRHRHAYLAPPLPSARASMCAPEGITPT